MDSVFIMLLDKVIKKIKKVAKSDGVQTDGEEIEGESRGMAKWTS